MSQGGPASQILGLVLVTDDRLLRGRELTAVCRAAERGGATSVLVRQEAVTPRDLAATVRAVLGAVGVPVLVAGRADVAIACGASGVLLASTDVPVQVVRRIAPRGFLIGAALGTLEEADGGRGADYWVIGPFHGPGGQEAGGIGPDRFTELLRRGEGRPCVAGGGVRPEDVRLVRQAGGVGVAVGKGILASQDIEAAARAYRDCLQ